MNARSLVNKNQFGEFELILNNNLFKIIAVCETWLKPYIPNNLIDGNDKYNVYRKDRYNQRGGGVCLFIAKLLDCTINVINLDLKYDCIEYLAVDITYHHEITRLTVAYIAPCKHESSAFSTLFAEFITQSCSVKYYNY